MSFQEKRIWVYGFLSAVVPGIYFVSVFEWVRNTPVGKIGYQIPMLSAIAIAIVLAVVARIVVSIQWPADTGRQDDRDARINRFGNVIGYYATGAGVALALALTMENVERFWIANVIYLAFSVSPIVASIVKIVAYRRGL
jgi:hypothetical protein